MQHLNPGTLVFGIRQLVRTRSGQECRLEHLYPMRLVDGGDFKYIGRSKQPASVGFWFLEVAQAGIRARSYRTEICGGGTLSPSDEVVLLSDSYGMVAVPFDNDGFELWHRLAGT